MPLYEFFCLECNNNFEVLCPISQRDMTNICTLCGAKNIKRLVGKVRKTVNERNILDYLTSSAAYSDWQDNESLKDIAKFAAESVGEDISEELEEI